MAKRFLFVVFLALLLALPVSGNSTFSDSDLPCRVVFGSSFQDRTATADTLNASLPNTIEVSYYLKFHFPDITEYSEMCYIWVYVPKSSCRFIESLYDADDHFERVYTYRIGDLPSQPVTVRGDLYRNSLGSPTGCQFLLFFDGWDIQTLRGSQFVTVYDDGGSVVRFATNGRKRYTDPSNAPYLYVDGWSVCAKVLTVGGVRGWENTVSVSKSSRYFVSVDRTYGSSAVDFYLGGSKVLSDFRSATRVYDLADFDALVLTDTSGKLYYLNRTVSSSGGAVAPVVFGLYDYDTRSSVSVPSWNLYVVDGSTGTSIVDLNFTGSSAVVDLPVTSAFVSHVVHVTADGYDQIPAQAFVSVQSGGGSVPIYLKSLTGSADPGNAWVQFNVTGESAPISDVLVSMNGESYFTGSTGIARFQVPYNASYSWSMSSDNYDSKRGSVTVGTSDVFVPVSLVHSVPDVPLPSDPSNPLFPVLSPALDPSSYRLVIEGVPYLGTMASPLLDTMDELVYGLDDVVRPVLDLLTMPADAITRSVSTVSDQLVSVSSGFVSTSSYVLNSVSMLVAVIPTKVINLVTFAMSLDIVLLLLRGGGI